LIKFGFQNIFPNTKTEKDKKIGKGKKKDERNQAGQMASQSQINKVATHTRARTARTKVAAQQYVVFLQVSFSSYF
jgi:hypothetical protein